MNEAQQRAAVVTEALTWQKTPYHHRAGIKGAGVDCLYLLSEVYIAVGLIERPEIPDYPMDIMLHRNEETYLNAVLRYCREVEAPQPGDIALWKFGRIFSHGAIVLDWPQIIHAHRLSGGVVLDEALGGERAGREVRFFSPWGR